MSRSSTVLARKIAFVVLFVPHAHLSGARVVHAQRVVPSASWHPAPTDRPVRIQLRPDAVVPPAVPRLASHGLLFERVRGFRADSLVVEVPGASTDSAGAPSARDVDYVTIPAADVAIVEVARYSRLRAGLESGGDAAFYAGLLGAAVGSLVGGGDRGGGALRGAGIGVLVGLIGGAASPDPNHGYRSQRLTLRVEP